VRSSSKVGQNLRGGPLFPAGSTRLRARETRAPGAINPVCNFQRSSVVNFESPLFRAFSLVPLIVSRTRKTTFPAPRVGLPAGQPADGHRPKRRCRRRKQAVESGEGGGSCSRHGRGHAKSMQRQDAQPRQKQYAVVLHSCLL